MKLLIIEPDRATAQTMDLMARSEGIDAWTTDLAEEGIDLARIYDYDIITLEMILPDGNGMDVLRSIRQAGVKTPVFVITGDAQIETKVAALAAGADDYMLKPFHRDEMIARIKAIVRRAKGHSANVVKVGAVSMDLDRKEIRVGGDLIHMTGREYQTLELLMMHPNRMQSRHQIMNYLYGGLDEPEMKIIDVFVCKVRKKLKDAGQPDIIQTCWGRGYTLVEPSLIPA